ncbi:glycoside hydrolase family 43 protein [Mucilaginibacter sp. RS28]|uniref:Glycoside hydrolase family 43 protein n=1 Tax=Mucilaginibacter straminoryzae TaxID=2932774 RepID=A0A9X2B7X6_9SPHI|nr:glycoside hydrolase family 43 protein [Mucilaginibacter straminoryzae]MCJ8208861.1 glycoside hydrolase family 43 protein [Mucilaginibacter straminoryzae]
MNNTRMTAKAVGMIFFLIGWLFTASAQIKAPAYKGYLFVYFTGNQKSEEAIRFAISMDGYHYYALNRNEPIVSSAQISETSGVRDPHILRSADGKTFYMVATDMVSANGWNSNRGLVLMKSKDLIHWSSAAINFQKRFPGQDSLLRVWAPQTIYDEAAKKYMVYFSLKHGHDPDKIYYCYANKDFTNLEGEPKQLFYSPDGAACIDGDIEEKDGEYYLFFKTEDRKPGIKIAVSKTLTSGYQLQSDEYVQQTDRPVEGAGTFKLNDGSGFILMYDMYTSGRYQFTKSADLKNFKVIDQEVSMNFKPRHGTVMPITLPELKRLIARFMPADAVLQTVKGKGLVEEKVEVDTLGKRLYLPLSEGTDPKLFQPKFAELPGVSVKPLKKVDFSAGDVPYQVTIWGRKPVVYILYVKK